MTIIDRQNKFSDKQVVTAAAASDYTVKSPGNAIGSELWLIISCDETAASGGATTVNFKLQTDTTDAFSGATDLFDSGAIAKAAITAGKELVKVRVPQGSKGFLRVYYGVNVANLTAGKFTAYLTEVPQTNNP